MTRRRPPGPSTVMVTALLDTLCGEHDEALAMLRQLDLSALLQFGDAVERLYIETGRELGRRHLPEVNRP